MLALSSSILLHDTTRLNTASIGPVVNEWEPSKFQLSTLYIGQGSSIYTHVWIFENGAHVRTPTLIVFQEITQEFSFNQPQTECQHTAYSPTCLVSGWLASSMQGMTGKGCVAKKISSFVTLPTSLGDKPCPPPPPPLVPAGSQLRPQCERSQKLGVLPKRHDNSLSLRN